MNNVKILKSIYSGYKSRAKRRNIGFYLTLEEFKKIGEQECFYCGLDQFRTHDKLFGLSFTGIDRVNNEGNYSEGNVVPCCDSCNIFKNNMDTEEFDFKLWSLIKFQIIKKFGKEVWIKLTENPTKDKTFWFNIEWKHEEKTNVKRTGIKKMFSQVEINNLKTNIDIFIKTL